MSTTTILKTAVADCGCSVDTYASGALVIPRRLNRCPLHAAAGEMRDAIKALMNVGRTAIDARPDLDWNDLCALLAKVEGR